MVRGKDACWEHCVLVDATRQKVRCNYCHREFSGGVYRMKFHLAQIKNKDIIPCTEVPDDVRDIIHSILSTHKKQKTPKKPKLDRAVNGPQISSSASGGFHANNNHAGSSEQHGSTCPSLLLPRPSPSSQPTLDDAQKQKHEDADKKIALFFLHNLIPFRTSQSIYYQAMIDAVAECGTVYKAPSYEELRSTLLEKVKGEMHESFNKRLKDQWKETGCTILSDSWSDGRSKSIVIFSVASPRGTHFLKSVDVSSHADDAYYLFELLDSVIIEVGVGNVVQLITESSNSYACASGLLLKKYPSLFWSPCASYCIEKMLEDISKQEWLSTVLEEARTITRYIYSNPWLLNMMRKFTGGRELIRPKVNRFVAHFLCIRSIVFQEDNLKHMFSHSDWLSSVYSRRTDAQAIKLLYSERFWKSAHEAVAVSEPLVKLLRVVDGDMPAMGYIYEGIERAKLSIKIFYKGCEEKYVPILEAIERRWSMQLHSHIHAAAAFLNPSICYNPNFKLDANMRNGFHAALWKMFPEENDRIELTKEQPVYVNAQGALGSEFAIMGRTLNAPGDWWAAYGYEVPILQKAAMRILNQPCSSYWYKWNWNTFENMHSKKRSKMELEKLGELVFVHCNLQLQAISQSKDGKCKPVNFDEIDVCSEWPTESESSSLVLDDSWLEDFPFACKGNPTTYDLI